MNNYSSTTFVFLVLLLLFAAGKMKADNQESYMPIGRHCEVADDCSGGGVYCVCDSGECFCSAKLQDRLLSKEKDQQVGH
ncbi:hypothetical protein LINPERHAP1_LOCUS36236 [Linum perenne]